MTQRGRHDLAIAHGYDEETHESRWYVLDNGQVIYETDEVERAVEVGRNLLGRNSDYLYFLWGRGWFYVQSLRRKAAHHLRVPAN